VIIRVGFDQMTTEEILKCSFIDLLVRSECSGADFMLYLSVSALLAGLILTYFAYRFYEKRDVSGDMRSQVKLILLASIAGGLILLALAPKTVNTYSEIADPVPRTAISLGPGYNYNGTLHLAVSNSGRDNVNITNFKIRYGPQDIEPVSYSALKAKNDSWTVEDGNKCFNGKMKTDSGNSQDIIKPGQRSTGIKFPDVLKQVEIVLTAKDFDYKTTKYCSADSEDAKSC
jgi:hypothetical protein